MKGLWFALSAVLAGTDLAAKQKAETIRKKAEQEEAKRGGVKSRRIKDRKAKEKEKKIGRYIRLRNVHNHGMALNANEEHPTLVRTLSVLAAVWVICCQIKTVCFGKDSGAGFWRKLSAAFLAAGAFSNTYDRLVRGYVVDYIGFETRWPRLSAVTYNLGDFFLATGVIFMSASCLISEGQEAIESHGED